MPSWWNMMQIAMISSHKKIKKIPISQAQTLTARDCKGFCNQGINACLVGGVQEIEDFLKIKEATVKGYTEAEAGDGVNLGVPNSNTRRGRVNKGGVNTLTTQSEMGVVTQSKQNLRIRKLTPKECWRLQGFCTPIFDEEGDVIGWDDTMFNRAVAAGVSNSQLYKQAGNAVSVPIAYAIGLRLAELEKESDSNILPREIASN